MPSDCQCSTACETRIVTKVLNNKQATRRLERLEKEVKKLRSENVTLKTKLSKASVKKKDLVSKLKKQLDRV